MWLCPFVLLNNDATFGSCFLQDSSSTITLNHQRASVSQKATSHEAIFQGSVIKHRKAIFEGSVIKHRKRN
ncbi:hypothetical protein YC2023_053579 [Brassica napus]